MIYSATLWWTKREKMLLDLKMSEERQFVDRWIISQANTTFRGNPRPFDTPVTDPKAKLVRVGTRKFSQVRQKHKAQRDSTLESIKLKQGDIFVFADLDEIIHEQDWPKILDGVEEHGMVRLSMRHYYRKINLLTGNDWASAFAFNYRYFKQLPKNQASVHFWRQSFRGTRISIRGQHFSWLGDDKTIRTKIANHAHPENDNEICLKNLLHNSGPHGQPTVNVPIDNTYPTSLLNNLEKWEPHIDIC